MKLEEHKVIHFYLPDSSQHTIAFYPENTVEDIILAV